MAAEVVSEAQKDIHVEFYNRERKVFSHNWGCDLLNSKYIVKIFAAREWPTMVRNALKGVTSAFPTNSAGHSIRCL